MLALGRFRLNAATRLARRSHACKFTLCYYSKYPIILNSYNCYAKHNFPFKLNLLTTRNINLRLYLDT